MTSCQCMLGLGGALLCLLVAFVTHVSITCWHGCGPPKPPSKPTITYFSTREWRDTKIKQLLLWTKNYGFPLWGLDSENYTFGGCAVDSCRITTNKSLLMKSDAVLFHTRTLWSYFLGHEMPPQHPAHQVWILHDFEPPAQTYNFLPSYDNVFNWTLFYRRDSDVISAFGRMVRLDDSSITWETETDPLLRVMGQAHGDVNQLTKGREMVTHNYHGDKPKFAVWVASNCFSQSRRELLVRRLRKFLDFDTLGKCGDALTPHCHRYEYKCPEDLGPYRFLFAFENSLCKDYSTEKVWNALERGQIPVVYGGTNYSRELPPNSYIAVDDFRTLKELAEYIKKVDSNPALYNSYMWWRAYYRVEVFPHFWCDLCAALHDSSRPAQTYSDLDGWFRNDICQQSLVYDIISRAVEACLRFINIDT